MSETIQYGMLASQAGYRLPLVVRESGARFDIGTFDCGPVSRESVEYWPTRELAQEALNTGNWTQRLHP